MKILGIFPLATPMGWFNFKQRPERLLNDMFIFAMSPFILKEWTYLSSQHCKHCYWQHFEKRSIFYSIGKNGSYAHCKQVLTNFLFKFTHERFSLTILGDLTFPYLIVGLFREDSQHVLYQKKLLVVVIFFCSITPLLLHNCGI
jgi:hypothetical protein